MVNKQYSATDLEAFMKIAANWQNSNHNILEGVDIKCAEMQQYLNNPAMNMYKKRERTQNWNHQEKKFLLDLCRKDMRIIENKRLDAGLTAVKNKAWKIIHQKFSSQFGTDRTCNRLKEQWRRMKACTRNEILDYNNRLTRFGAEVADRKKPSPFTFEVWEFMQEAKRACKSEALDGIDYSKIQLALEEDYDYKEDEQNMELEHDMDDSRTPPQDLCDVDIKEETNETFNDTYNNNNNNNSDSLVNGMADRLSNSPIHCRSAASLNGGSGSMNGIDLEHSSLMHSPAELGGFLQPPPATVGDLANFQPAFNMNNISATLEALNALRSGQFSTAAAAAAALQNNFAAVHQQHQQQQQHQHQQHLQHQQHQQHQQQQQQQLQQAGNSRGDEEPCMGSPQAKRQRTSSGGGASSSSTAGLDDLIPVPCESSIPLTVPQPSGSAGNSNNPTAAICVGNAGVGVGLVGASAATAVALGGHARVASPSPPATGAVGGVGGETSTPELRTFMEMQSKEHLMRMKILEVQLQAAKYGRDLVEINKTLALQKLQELASKRLIS